MDILVVGGGGREHALVESLRKSPKVNRIFCAPGNGGISAAATCVDIRATNLPAMVRFAQDNKIDFVVVAPDDPLALGMVDALNEKGIATFGPTAAAARIEASKVFSKDLMRRYGIPTAGYETFDQEEAALDYIRCMERFPVVIKADGLALGKGVVIAQNQTEAEAAVQSMMRDKIFGESGSRIVVEEFLTGPEVSVLSFCDGKTLVPMISSMDHKRALDGNQGPNTGGMGTISPNPHYTPELAQRCMEEIFLPTVKAMQAEGSPFSGCLYFGLMLTPDGPKVIEYNCRFGDPETQVVLPMLETDLPEIMLAISDQRLDQMEIRWKSGACACVVLASGGYPGKYETGLPIQGLNTDGQLDDGVVFHAGTRLKDGVYETAGGRVLGVSCTGNTLDEALESAYRCVDRISFDGMQFRRDIGNYR